MADLELKHIYYAYPRTKNQVLQEVNAIFPGGQVCSICGQSGAGKSTLLYLAAGIDMPVAGEVIYEGRILTRDMLDEYRRKDASIISQNYLLFPTWTVLENVCYPMELVKREKREAVAEAKRHLQSVGIGENLYDRLPQKLSGGEQQRVAIARCLASHCQVIVADEPTGNLDEKNAKAIMNMLLALAHDQGKTVIIVTHDREIAAMADVHFYLENGSLREVEV